MSGEHARSRRADAVAGTLALCGLVLGATLFVAWFRLGLPLPSCRFRAWTGLPCATCGTTRLLRALASGSFMEAMSLNPLVFCGLGLIAAWGSQSAVRLALNAPARRGVLGSKDHGRLLLIAAAAVIANWIYLLLAGI